MLNNYLQETNYMGTIEYEEWLMSGESDILAEKYMQEERVSNQTEIDVDFCMCFDKLI